MYITGLFRELDLRFVINDWRLFLDASSRSQKILLLHNEKKENQHPAIPLAYTTLKESYENTKMILQKIEYSTYNWEIIGDFKMINYLMGMQQGKIKLNLFYFEFNCKLQRRIWFEKVRYHDGLPRQLFGTDLNPTNYV